MYAGGGEDPRGGTRERKPAGGAEGGRVREVRARDSGGGVSPMAVLVP